MSATVQVDDLYFRDKLNQLSSMGLETGRVLRVESRKLLQDIIKNMPPNDRRQGEAAVRVDLLKLFFPVESHAIAFARRSQKKAVADYVPLWTTGGGHLFACAHANFKPDLDAGGMAQIHAVSKNDKGRVRGGGRMFTKATPKRTMINRIVVKRAAFNAYAREVATHVGRLKGGFTVALLSVGGTQPSWVTRNAKPSEGFVVNNLGRGASPSITIGNTSQGANRLTRQTVEKAMGWRVKSIAENIKRMLKFGPGAASDYGYGN